MHLDQDPDLVDHNDEETDIDNDSAFGETA